MQTQPIQNRTNPFFMLLLVPSLAGVTMLQGMLGPWLSLAEARPDFVLLLVLVWTLMRGRREGMIAGFIGGFWLDFLGMGPLGLSSLALVTTSFGIGIGRRSVRATHILVPSWVAAVGTLLYALIYYAALAVASGTWAWLREMRDYLAVQILYQIALMFFVLPLWQSAQRRAASEPIHVR